MWSNSELGLPEGKELENRVKGMYSTMDQKEIVGVNLKISITSHASNIILEFPKLEYRTSLFSLALQSYPTCCGLMMMHTFIYNEAFFKEEEIHRIMEVVVREGLLGRMYFNSGRLQIAMVEQAKVEVKGAIDAFPQILNGPDPNREMGEIHYPFFYSYFQKQLKVNTQLMYNYNTANIIHMMEVIFDTKRKYGGVK